MRPAIHDTLDLFRWALLEEKGVCLRGIRKQP